MTRRAFVVGAMALLVSVMLSSLFAVKRKWGAVQRRWAWYRDAQFSLEDRIRGHFDYLSLDPAGVRAFAETYQKQNGPIGLFASPEPEVYERYLLSTDFFQHGADESRTPGYVTYYDPYLSPCWNPCVEWT
jgi:hypothetical protein